MEKLLVDPEIKKAYLYKLSIETLAAKKGLIPWLNAEEAFLVLGIRQNTKAATKLAWLVSNGIVAKTAGLYWWDDLTKVANEIAIGKIEIPTQFGKTA